MSLKRSVRLIEETVERLGLNLSGLIVLTEAATGHYAVTAAMSVSAGADHVYAIAKDSTWGGAADAAAATRALAAACGNPGHLTILDSLSGPALGDADIVTNLGFVRPVDSRFVLQMKQHAVVSLMCEPWEVRPGDVDLGACARHGIVVIGTNEHSPEWPVFSYSGPLAKRMLLEAGFELLRTRVTIVGRDAFAPVIARALEAAGAEVQLIRNPPASADVAAMKGADAVIVADYASEDVIIGAHGLLRTSDLVSAAPDAVVIQFAGAVDHRDLRASGVRVWPDPPVPSRRMSRTFAALGPRPVIELHGAGLRVGEAAARIRRRGTEPHDVIRTVCAELSIASDPAGPAPAGIQP